MSDFEIKVENLSKQYKIGTAEASYKTLRESIVNAVQAPFRRAAGLLRGESYGAAGLDETIWALKDVSFEVKQGEIVGIIGRNGAGKSTLLKILSRITEPTEGRAVLNGRVGSLLEVGTGFHPELTGRENIYLNGSILGMRREEIEAKFDQIVDFSGIGKFIDTPVKHYSSGMYVRLAFSVAAHLEPDILLVDEVLAVGDAAFQKKCLGKMESVAQQGRTVLFVSHNMAAINSLCKRAILLDYGKIALDGAVSDVVQSYLASVDENVGFDLDDRRDRKGDGRLRITNISLTDGHGNPVECLQSGMDTQIVFHYKSPSEQGLRNVLVAIAIDSIWGQRLCVLQTDYVGTNFSKINANGKFVCSIPSLPLAPGVYPFTFFVSANGIVTDWVPRAGRIRVEGGDFYGHGKFPAPASQDGPLLINYNWMCRDGR